MWSTCTDIERAAREASRRRANGGLTSLRIARRVATGRPHDGKLIAGSLVLPCALGRLGVTHAKREGDGATPAGRHALLYVFLRRGRISLAGVLPAARFLRRDEIWCDDPKSFLYNRLLRAPSRLGHEEMWRNDRLYDIVGVLDYNIRPVVRGRGSAIFFHVATDDLAPTAGCVALRARDMARLLPHLARKVALLVT